ncbi:MAG: NUDIX domain-containing protein, partial [Candidatus Pacebacteria bacterium]|nr:NUDIX domain-containing protein [Candidatus Paceibacterota bacterium]
IISLLKEIVELCESNNMKYWIIGGFAVDGKRRCISRDHGDINICFHNSEKNKDLKIFFNNNFTITKQGLKYVFYKYDIKIDVFILFDKNKYYERKREWFEAKFPKKIFDDFQLGKIGNLNFKIPSNEGLKYYGSKTREKKDQLYCEKLTINSDLYSKIFYNEFADYKRSTKNIEMKEIIVINSKIIEIEYEFLDVLDQYGNKTKKSKLLSQVHRDGSWHESSHVWIYNSKKEILFQKRARTTFFPGLLDISVGGHIAKGKRPKETAIREVKEEINLKIKDKDLKKIGRKKMSLILSDLNFYNNEFVTIYLLKFDGDISSFQLQDREVENVKFIPINKLRSDLKDPKLYKKFVPHGKYYFYIINRIEKELKINH